MLTSANQFQQFAVIFLLDIQQNLSIHQIYFKIPNQDKQIDDKAIQFYMDYILKNYPNGNIRSIISEYSVFILIHSFISRLYNGQQNYYDIPFLLLLFLRIVLLFSQIFLHLRFLSTSIQLKLQFYDPLVLQEVKLIQRIKILKYSFFSFFISMLAIIISPLALGISIGILVSYLICKQEAMMINIPLVFEVNFFISFFFIY